MTQELNEQDRQSQLERLFQRNYGSLRDLAAEDPRLLANDSDHILQALASRLAEYSGNPEDEAFLTWAASVIRPAVSRISRFYHLRRQYYRSVLKGIWGVLRGAGDLSDYDDPRRTARALADEVWLWVFENLEKVDTPGTAALSTRLQAKGMWKARSWKTARLRERKKRVDFDVAFVGKDDNGFYLEPSCCRTEESA